MSLFPNWCNNVGCECVNPGPPGPQGEPGPEGPSGVVSVDSFIGNGGIGLVSANGGGATSIASGLPGYIVTGGGYRTWIDGTEDETPVRTVSIVVSQPFIESGIGKYKVSVVNHGSVDIRVQAYINCLKIN